MASKKIQIKDYFKYGSTRNFSKDDWEEFQEVRDALNKPGMSFSDKHKYIYERRLKPYNVKRDYELFQIPEDATIDRFTTARDGSFYDSSSYNNNNKRQKQENESTSNNTKSRSKNKKEIKSKIGKNGKIKKSSKLSNIGKNIATKTKPGKALSFILNNFVIVLKISLVIIALFLITTLAIFIAGTFSSIGATPFVMCGGDQDNWTMTKMIEASNVQQMATKEYGCQVFIFSAKEHGWTNEAIVGVLSYILQEGGAMGTFTYEGNYKWNGPSGELYDKTLDNTAWVEWLPNEGKEQAHAWYAENTSHYAAIGLGLIQSSDVWENDGTMDAAYATELIQYAENAGKPWQDPQTQMNYYFSKVFSGSTAFDEEGVDPTKDVRTAEEWCRRITAGVGMPAYSYTDDNDYMQDHLDHLEEATALFATYTGVDLRSLDFNVIDLCAGYNPSLSGGNSSIADAAVTLAGVDGREDIIDWDQNGPDSPNLQDPRLKAYKAVHIAIFPGDDLFASCDRSAACAIRWSGADDTFPSGDTTIQYQYISNSPKWAFIGYFGSAELKPGDVLITEGNGHIKIYVGNIAVQKKYPGSTSDMYAGAFEEFFPLVYQDTNWDSRVYAVYRNIVPDNSTTYDNIVIE